MVNALFLVPDVPARLCATFDWRTHPGWRGGTWLRDENVSPDAPDLT